MGKAKPETVAKYHKEHLRKFCVMFRRDEDEAILEYLEQCGERPSDVLRKAMRMYMKESQ